MSMGVRLCAIFDQRTTEGTGPAISTLCQCVAPHSIPLAMDATNCSSRHPHPLADAEKPDNPNGKRGFLITQNQNRCPPSVHGACP